MRNLRYISLLLCLCLLVQSVPVPAFAAETSETTAASEVATQETTQIPFGRVCIDNGEGKLVSFRALTIIEKTCSPQDIDMEL